MSIAITGGILAPSELCNIVLNVIRSFLDTIVFVTVFV